MSVTIEMPGIVLEILSRLEQKGFEAYAVGGCVRDSLCGRTPHDWDLCTNAIPEEIHNCFLDKVTLDTGEKHGTVTVLWNHQPVEITTFRTEGAYLDNRHPSEVRFVRSLDEDLTRRDFTINAMAYHPVRGLIDLHGGREDLAKGVLRCVGDSLVRFSEDALRILRGLRFAACYSLTISPETSDAIKKLAPLLKRISVERIDTECCKLLLAEGKNVAGMLRDFPEVWTILFPEMIPMIDCQQNHPRHLYDVWEHTLHVLEAVPPQLYLRWAALFHDIGKPACRFTDASGMDHFYGHPAVSKMLANQILHRYHTDHRRIQAVCTLVEHHDISIPTERKAMRRLIARLGEDTTYQLLLLLRADRKGQSDFSFETDRGLLDQAFSLLEEIRQEKACLHLKDLAVSGRDLLATGVKEGPQVGTVLRTLLQMVIEEQIPNEREHLLNAVKKLIR